MKRPSNDVLLFDQSIASSLGYSDSSCRESADSLVAIGFDSRTPPRPPTGYVISRYLDRFYVVLPTSDGGERDSILKRFFAWLAPHYEAAIDVGRNLENIRLLLDIVEKRFGVARPRRILDFGCGTGLAMELVRGRGLDYVGYDSCARMRAIAAHHGCKIVDSDELGSTPTRELFDAVIASYVMHFKPDFSSLELGWAVLRPRGLFVANFHKGVGLVQFRDFAADHGIALEFAGGGHHGVYVVAWKADTDQS